MPRTVARDRSPASESCVAGACHLVRGDTCGSAIALTTGVNTIAWTAFSTDYLTASPSCASGYTTTGPDLVLTYTATGSELVTLAFDKPTSTSWAAVLSTEPCGTFSSGDTCVSEFSFTEMSASIWLDAGATVHAYLVDTTSGTLPSEFILVDGTNARGTALPSEFVPHDGPPSGPGAFQTHRYPSSPRVAFAWRK